MTYSDKIYGVYLSEGLDLNALYGAAMTAEDVILLRPEEVTDPAQIRFALCWAPSPEAFDVYKNLSLVMSIGAGVDKLLAHPGLPAGCKVARVRDPHQAALMAGYAVHEVLHYERAFATLTANAAKAQWARVAMRAPEQAVVAVLGNGSMGAAVTEALCALGFTCRVACRSAAEAPRAGVSYHSGADGTREAARGADYLINVLPLTAATENVLNAALFAQLNPGAYLIQIGRGAHLVDEDLLPALESGQLAGATLDVFRTEPLPADHPFWQDRRLRLTPHIASDTMPESVCAQVTETARALRDAAPLRLVIDRRQGY